MSDSFFAQFMNQGEDAPRTVEPDGIASFALSDEDYAFANAFNMQIHSTKSILAALMSFVEKETKAQTQIWDTIKGDFLQYLAAKHGVKDVKGTFQLDFKNKLFVVRPEKPAEE